MNPPTAILFLGAMSFSCGILYLVAKIINWLYQTHHFLGVAFGLIILGIIMAFLGIAGQPNPKPKNRH